MVWFYSRTFRMRQQMSFSDAINFVAAGMRYRACSILMNISCKTVYLYCNHLKIYENNINLLRMCLRKYL